MKLTFLGTRGETRKRSESHYMHSSLLVSHGGARIMIDCGYDWLGAWEENRGEHPDESSETGLMKVHTATSPARATPAPNRRRPPKPGLILITHAHPDHAWGLREGSPCPVYASQDTWREIGGFSIAPRRRRIAMPGEPVSWRGITFESFPVEHSIRAPANGYRISAGRLTFFYVPDVVYIYDRDKALGGADLYIGDGATLKRPFVRRKGDVLFGHAPVRTQLTWCRKEGIPAAIFTHCGTGIVEGDVETVAAEVKAMGGERGVLATVAEDGFVLTY
jgi:glyoxylase-like metal-dependent hydrolase (beta-lactamase superfamily II)